jgi:hypothetical protein
VTTKADDGPAPHERSRTVRDAIRRALRLGPLTALQISSTVGIPHKAVAGHLEHLRRSAKGAGERFVVEPAFCHDCDFEFEDRARLTKPSRCPKCKGERLEAPRFRIEPG